MSGFSTSTNRKQPGGDADTTLASHLEEMCYNTSRCGSESIWLAESPER
jgi:hypothetical protein